jgi:methylmalonyl-CoA epimerase
MIKKINHIGIAVKSIDEALILYTDVLGLKVEDIEVVKDQKLKTAIIPVGDSKIELIESIDPEGTIAKYIEKRGEGLHHIALEVNNIKSALEIVANKGVPLIDERPKKGVGSTIIGFLHPKGTKVLMEFVELRRE